MTKAKKQKLKKHTRPNQKPKTRPEPRTQAEFAALQKEWYDYLAKTGFEDLEWVDHKTGKGQGSDYLKSPSTYIAKQYDSSVEEHYRKCRIFLAHGEIESKLLKYVFELYTDGKSYREIAKEVRNKKQWFGRTISIFWISQHLNELLEFVDFWHYLDPNGVNFPDSDFYISEIPLKPSEPQSE